MSNLVQESCEAQKGEDEVLDPRFSMLCLNSSGGGGQHHCASCGFPQPRSAASATPMKRRSPTPFQDPNSTSKRLFLDPQHNHSQDLPHAFSRIDLPIPFGPSAQIQVHSPLRRSLSDPDPAQHLNGPTLPPPPLPLRRTVSDPNPSPGPDNISGSPNKVAPTRDSPDSKRLTGIKERLREMNELWNELMKEHEERDTKKSGGCKDEGEESVGVERVGDSLEIHLKCPCGKGFEILLNGTSCFYKLL